METRSEAPNRQKRPESIVESGTDSFSEFLLSPPIESLSPAERLLAAEVWTSANRQNRENVARELAWRQAMRQVNGTTVVEAQEEARHTAAMLGRCFEWAVVLFVVGVFVWTVGIFQGWWR